MDTTTAQTGTQPPPTTVTDLGRDCALCSSPGGTHGALLPDATVIDPRGQGRDGRRHVTACGTEHLQVLIDRARRDWVAETTMVRTALPSQHTTSDPRTADPGS